MTWKFGRVRFCRNWTKHLWNCVLLQNQETSKIISYQNLYNSYPTFIAKSNEQWASVFWIWLVNPEELTIHSKIITNEIGTVQLIMVQDWMIGSMIGYWNGETKFHKTTASEGF